MVSDTLADCYAYTPMAKGKKQAAESEWRPRQSKLTKNPLFSTTLPPFFQLFGTPNPKSPPPSELLERALKLFNGGRNWTKDEYIGKKVAVWSARKQRLLTEDDFDSYDEASAREVVVYCAMGGIQKVNSKNEYLAVGFLAYAVNPSDATEKMEELLREGDNKPKGAAETVEEIITDWNDAGVRKWPQVRDKFKEAIRLAKSLGC